MPTRTATTIFTNPAGHAKVRSAPNPLRTAGLQPLLTQPDQLLQRGFSEAIP